MMSTPRQIREVMEPIQAVVFDKDGTLIDLNARWAPYFNRFIDDLARSLGDPAAAPKLKHLLGIEARLLLPDSVAAVETEQRMAERIVAELAPRGHDAEAAMRAIDDVDCMDHLGPLQPIGPVTAALESLANSGYLLGVATSDERANSVRELAELGIDQLIGWLRCGDDDGPVKPDGQVLVGLARHFDCPVDTLLFVGDSEQDMATARASGSKFVVRCDPAAPPGWVDQADGAIADIGELLDDQPGDTRVRP